jgi:hypothetical protein
MSVYARRWDRYLFTQPRPVDGKIGNDERSNIDNPKQRFRSGSGDPA